MFKVGDKVRCPSNDALGFNIAHHTEDGKVVGMVIGITETGNVMVTWSGEVVDFWIHAPNTLRPANDPNIKLRVVWEYDEWGVDYDFFQDTEEEYLKVGPHINPDGTPIPFEEYKEYFGNPERHVALRGSLKMLCPCCGVWSYPGIAVGGVDYMDDDMFILGEYDEDELDTIGMDPYQLDLSKDLIAEFRHG